MKILSLDHVSKSHRNEKGVGSGIEDVTISFERGDFVLVAGIPDEGKTTFLNIISFMDDCDQGDIVFDGMSTIDFSKKEFSELRENHVGYVNNEPHLIENLTVLENLCVALRHSGLKEDKAKEKAKEALALCHIESLSDTKAMRLSDCERQKVNLTRMLAMGKDINILDCPFAEEDKEMALAFLSVLKEHSKDSLVFLATNDIPMFKGYANRLIQIENGHITSDERLADSPNVPDAKRRKPGKESVSSFLKTGKEVFFSSPTRLRYLLLCLFPMVFSILLGGFAGSYMMTASIDAGNSIHYKAALFGQGEGDLFLHATKDSALPETMEKKGLSYYSPDSYYPYIRFESHISGSPLSNAIYDMERYASLPSSARLVAGEDCGDDDEGFYFLYRKDTSYYQHHPFDRVLEGKPIGTLNEDYGEFCLFNLPSYYDPKPATGPLLAVQEYLSSLPCLGYGTIENSVQSFSIAMTKKTIQRLDSLCKEYFDSLFREDTVDHDDRDFGLPFSRFEETMMKVTYRGEPLKIQYVTPATFSSSFLRFPSVYKDVQKDIEIQVDGLPYSLESFYGLFLDEETLSSRLSRTGDLETSDAIFVTDYKDLGKNVDGQGGDEAVVFLSTPSTFGALIETEILMRTKACGCCYFDSYQSAHEASLSLSERYSVQMASYAFTGDRLGFMDLFIPLRPILIVVLVLLVLGIVSFVFLLRKAMYLFQSDILALMAVGFDRNRILVLRLLIVLIPSAFLFAIVLAFFLALFGIVGLVSSFRAILPYVLALIFLLLVGTVLVLFYERRERRKSPLTRPIRKKGD